MGPLHRWYRRDRRRHGDTDRTRRLPAFRPRSTFVVLTFLCASVFLSLALAEPTPSLAAAPDILGVYSENDICTSCGGHHFSYAWDITSEDAAAGSFSGTESGGGGGTLTGTITGSSVSMISVDPGGYTWWPTGTIASDCSMSGNWTDSNGNSGTWTATPESGQCGSDFLGNPGFEDPLGGTQYGGAVGQSVGNWLAYVLPSCSGQTAPARLTSPTPVHDGSWVGEVTVPAGCGGAYFSQDLPAFDPNSSYTLSAWVYPMADGQAAQLVFGWDRGVVGTRQGGSEVFIYADHTEFGAWGQNATARAMTYNTWHHIQLSVDAGDY